MKRVLLTLCLVIGTMGVARANSNDLIVTDWIQVDSGEKEEKNVFHRYAMIFNIDSAGNRYLSDLRNVVNFHCAYKGESPSYLNFFVPREISVEELLGANHFPQKSLKLEFYDGTAFNGVFEVQNNQLFLDLTPDSAPLFQKMSEEQPFTLWITSEFGVRFSYSGAVKLSEEWIPGDGKKTYQQFILDQLALNGTSVTQTVASKDLFPICAY